MWVVGQGSGRGGGGDAGGPDSVGATRAEGSEVERVDKMWRTLDVGAWCQRAVREQRRVHWFHRLP